MAGALMKQFIECSTQAQVDKVTGEGNAAVVRNGRFIAKRSSHVVAWGSSHVEAWGSSHVVAWGSSHVVAWGSSHVVARGSSHVVARGSSHVEAWGSSHVEAWGSSHVEAWESSHVVARESSHVVAWGSSHVEASDYVSVHKHGTQPKVKGGVLIEVPRCDTAEKWCAYYGVKVSRGIATLYKAVRDDYRSSRGMSYAPGTKPEAPDWDPVPECGGGLHFSFHPTAAQSFDPEASRFLACPVRLDEIVVHADGMYPNKVKAPRVVGRGCVEVDRTGKPIATVAS
jgi:hypothetical protein